MRVKGARDAGLPFEADAIGFRSSRYSGRGQYPGYPRQENLGRRRAALSEVRSVHLDYDMVVAANRDQFLSGMTLGVAR